jgi:hypothetical protein
MIKERLYLFVGNTTYYFDMKKKILRRYNLVVNRELFEITFDG